MNSTVGRPRTVTDAQVEAILTWHRTRKTMRQLAQEMGLPKTTVGYVISRSGQYKQPSPELRPAAVRARRAKLKTLAVRGWL